MALKAESQPPALVATSITMGDEDMRVYLTNGQILIVPFNVTASLQTATPQQRRNWRFICGGFGVHWEDLDEDLSIAGLARDYASSAEAFTGS